LLFHLIIAFKKLLAKIKNINLHSLKEFIFVLC